MISLKFEIENTNKGNAEDEKLFEMAGGCCFDFHKQVEHLFLVGTEEGHIHKCSKDYKNQYLLTYEVIY